MDKEKAKQLPKKLSNPKLVDLPPYLKDYRNFEKIQKALYDAGGSRCDSHNEVFEWANCKKCERRQWERKELMQKLGFANGAQYIEWVKVQRRIQELKAKYPLAEKVLSD